MRSFLYGPNTWSYQGIQWRIWRYSTIKQTEERKDLYSLWSTAQWQREGQRCWGNGSVNHFLVLGIGNALLITHNTWEFPSIYSKITNYTCWGNGSVSHFLILGIGNALLITHNTWEFPSIYSKSTIILAVRGNGSVSHFLILGILFILRNTLLFIVSLPIILWKSLLFKPLPNKQFV